jgi:hypothetical protein
MKAKLTILGITNISYFIMLLALTVIQFMLGGCKDKDDPPNQQQVKKDNTMAYTSLTTCKVNDKEWRDCFPGGLINQNRSSGQWWKNYIGDPLEIFATSGCDINNYTEIGIRINNFTGVGRYELGVHSYGNFVFQRISSPIIYKTDTIHRGAVEITSFDIEKKQVEGNFYFEAYNSDSSNSIQITTGKFSKVSFITF